MDETFVRELLTRTESATLDFKREHHASDAELAKDLMAIANLLRPQDRGHIVFGADEDPIDGTGVVVGLVAVPPDDANLQQRVLHKLNRVPPFTYQTFLIDGQTIGVLELVGEGRVLVRVIAPRLPFGAPARQSQHVVDDQSAVNVSAFRAFPQTVARILWTGRVDTAGEHMFSSKSSQRCFAFISTLHSESRACVRGSQCSLDQVDRSNWASPVRKRLPSSWSETIRATKNRIGTQPRSGCSTVSSAS